MRQERDFINMKELEGGKNRGRGEGGEWAIEGGRR